MSGSDDLEELLSAIDPVLSDEEYVFCTLPDARYGDFAELNPLLSFREQEGLTLVLEKEAADDLELPYDSVFRNISLQAHSSFNVVGLAAAISTPLAEQGISINIVGAFYHDYIFVGVNNAERALAVLKGLTEQFAD